MVNTDQKHLREDIFIWISCSDHSPLLKEVKAGTWKQALREGEVCRNAATWLALHSLCSLFSLQGPPSWGDRAHNSLGPPTSIIDHENTTTRLLSAGQSEGGIFSTEISSSQITLAHVELTKI